MVGLTDTKAFAKFVFYIIYKFYIINSDAFIDIVLQTQNIPNVLPRIQLGFKSNNPT